MNGRSASYSSLISAIGKKILWHLLQQFNTHEHFVNMKYFSGKSHILANAASLARGLIDYTSGNTT